MIPVSESSRGVRMDVEIVEYEDEATKKLHECVSKVKVSLEVS